MNNGLEALSKLEDIVTGLRCDLRQENELYVRDFGQDELISIIYKQMNALEIIKNKQIDMFALLDFDELLQYNTYINTYNDCVIRGRKKREFLGQQEFDLLKEVLCDE